MTFHNTHALFSVTRTAPVLLLVLVLSVLGGCAHDPYAGITRATPDAAQALVEKARILLEAEGAAALDLISDDPQFKDGELYVFVTDSNGIFVAHGFDKSRFGRNIKEIRDIDGRPYGLAIQRDATRKGIWIPYKRTSPVTGEEEWKFSFVQRSSNGYVLGAGVYLGF